MSHPTPDAEATPAKPINYVFIDYENVKAEGLDLLDPDRFHVVIFCGEHQKSLPITVTQAQNNGLRVEPVTIEGRTREALDLHLAFYLGRLISTVDSSQQYYLHIVSKDKGFDPLVQHLISRGYMAARAESILLLPRIRNKLAKTLAQRLPIVLEKLKAMGDHRPARRKTLTGTIRSLFPSETNLDDIEALIKILQSRRIIKIDDQKISYNTALLTETK